MKGKCLLVGDIVDIPADEVDSQLGGLHPEVVKQCPGIEPSFILEAVTSASDSVHVDPGKTALDFGGSHELHFGTAGTRKKFNRLKSTP